MSRDQRSMEGKFRVGRVSEWVEISPRQINRWCQDGSFIPQDKVTKTDSSAPKSKEQRYTVQDICNLFIISLFQRTGLPSIGEINKIMGKYRGYEGQAAYSLKQYAKSRLKYLQCLNQVLKYIGKYKIEIVFALYAQLMESELRVGKYDSKISAVLKKISRSPGQFVNHSFEEGQLMIHDVSNLTGMNIRTLHRLYGTLKEKGIDKKQFQKEDCYRYFLMVLMQEVNEREYILQSKEFRTLEIASMLEMIKNSIEKNSQVLKGIVAVSDTIVWVGIHKVMKSFVNRKESIDKILIELPEKRNDVASEISIDEEKAVEILKIWIECARGLLEEAEELENDGNCHNKLYKMCKDFINAFQEFWKVCGTGSMSYECMIKAILDANFDEGIFSKILNQHLGDGAAVKIVGLLDKVFINGFIIPHYSVFLTELCKIKQSPESRVTSREKMTQNIVEDFLKKIAHIYGKNILIEKQTVCDDIAIYIELVSKLLSIDDYMISFAEDAVSYYLRSKRCFVVMPTGE